jgi:hypothetical protein
VQTTPVKDLPNHKVPLLRENVLDYRAKTWDLVGSSAMGAAFLALSTLHPKQCHIFCCDLSH